MQKKTTERWSKAFDKAMEGGYAEGWKEGWIKARNSILRGELIGCHPKPWGNDQGKRLSQKDLEEKEMLKKHLFGEDEEDEDKARRLRGKRPKRK